jgi:putative exosortase-associated protein (TIGR04073 family)
MRTVAGLILAGWVLAAGAYAWADEPPQAQEAGESEAPGVARQIGVKLVRGLANLGFGWVEMPKQIYLIGRERGWLVGTFRGPVEGLGMFLARTVAGGYEIFSFPFPLPPHYQPLMQPEFVWQPDQAHAETPDTKPQPQ